MITPKNNPSISSRVPDALRASIQTTLGAWRDVTRLGCVGRSLQDAERKIAAVFGGQPNMYGDKGALRTRERLVRTLGDQLLMFNGKKVDRRTSRVIAFFFTVGESDLRLHYLDLMAWAGVGCKWKISNTGGVSRHAAARYIERTTESDVTLASVVIGSYEAVAYTNTMRNDFGVVFPQVPMPLSSGDLVAVVDAREPETHVITFIAKKTLSGQRLDWVNRYHACQSDPERRKLSPKEQLETVAAVMREGAEMWAETRERGLRYAA